MENQVEFKWISVSEKMPENQKTVFFIELKHGYRHIHIGYFFDKKWYSETHDFDGSEKVTHWLEIPLLPTV